MESLKTFVTLAASGPLQFVASVMAVLLFGWFIYFAYRSFRDLEVFLLERKQLEGELLEREEDPEG